MRFLLSKYPIDGVGILYPDFSFNQWPEEECPLDKKGHQDWAVVGKINSEL